FFRRMSVSRDFIDSCSPEAPARIEQDAVAPPLGGLTQASAQCGGTTLVFGFPATLRILRNALISLSKPYRFLYLGKRPRPSWAPPRSPRRRRAGRRGLLRIPHQFLTSCLPASLIIRLPLWDVRGPVVRPGRRGRNL